MMNVLAMASGLREERWVRTKGRVGNITAVVVESSVSLSVFWWWEDWEIRSDCDSVLEMMMLRRSGSGRKRKGMEDQVLRPMITALRRRQWGVG